MTLKEMVTDNKKVRFVHFRDGEFTYRTEDGFEFVVPIGDVGTGTFKAEDKAILFMRWIRKQIEIEKEYDLEVERAWRSGDMEEPDVLSVAAVQSMHSIFGVRFPEENVLTSNEEDDK